MLYWLLHLELENLKLVYLRMAKHVNMPYWPSLWVWSKWLFAQTKWTSLNHHSLKVGSMKYRRKSVDILKRLDTNLQLWHLCLFQDSMVTTWLRKVIGYDWLFLLNMPWVNMAISIPCVYICVCLFVFMSVAGVLSFIVNIWDIFAAYTTRCHTQYSKWANLLLILRISVPISDEKR